MNETKRLTRIAVIPDNRRMLLGIDKGRIFKDRTVYDAETDIYGRIILTPIGTYTLSKKGIYSELSLASDIMEGGYHLITTDEIDDVEQAIQDRQNQRFMNMDKL